MVITSADPRQNLKPMQTGSALRRSFYLNQNSRHFLRSLGPQSINKGACFFWPGSPLYQWRILWRKKRGTPQGMPLALAVE